jgi:hypothetical protein
MQSQTALAPILHMPAKPIPPAIRDAANACYETRCDLKAAQDAVRAAELAQKAAFEAMNRAALAHARANRQFRAVMGEQA